MDSRLDSSWCSAMLRLVKDHFESAGEPLPTAVASPPEGGEATDPMSDASTGKGVNYCSVSSLVGVAFPCLRHAPWFSFFFPLPQHDSSFNKLFLNSLLSLQIIPMELRVHVVIMIQVQVLKVKEHQRMAVPVTSNESVFLE